MTPEVAQENLKLQLKFSFFSAMISADLAESRGGFRLYRQKAHPYLIYSLM